MSIEPYPGQQTNDGAEQAPDVQQPVPHAGRLEDPSLRDLPPPDAVQIDPNDFSTIVVPESIKGTVLDDEPHNSRAKKIIALVAAASSIAAGGYGGYKLFSGDSEAPKSTPSASAPAVPGTEAPLTPTETPSTAETAAVTGEVIGTIDTTGLGESAITLAKNLTPENVAKMTHEELTAAWTITEQEALTTQDYAEQEAVLSALSFTALFTDGSVDEYNKFVAENGGASYGEYMLPKYLAMTQGMLGPDVAPSDENTTAFVKNANRFALFRLLEPTMEYSLTATISNVQVSSTTYPLNEASAVITLKESPVDKILAAINIPPNDRIDMSGSYTRTSKNVTNTGGAFYASEVQTTS